jgi:hypothetical protein
LKREYKRALILRRATEEYANERNERRKHYEEVVQPHNRERRARERHRASTARERRLEYKQQNRKRIDEAAGVNNSFVLSANR